VHHRGKEDSAERLAHCQRNVIDGGIEALLCRKVMRGVIRRKVHHLQSPAPIQGQQTSFWQVGAS
jgi:hypothetical protein